MIDGLVLSGGRPGLRGAGLRRRARHGPRRDAGRRSTRRSTRAPGARAAFVVSPTYYGLAADVAALAEVAHARGVPLIVDQSWGPHFGFHSEVPESALRLGADAALTSTHKIVGSLTQSAMLHVGADRPGGHRRASAAPSGSCARRRRARC